MEKRPADPDGGGGGDRRSRFYIARGRAAAGVLEGLNAFGVAGIAQALTSQAIVTVSDGGVAVESPDAAAADSWQQQQQQGGGGGLDYQPHQLAAPLSPPPAYDGRGRYDVAAAVGEVPRRHGRRPHHHPEEALPRDDDDSGSPPPPLVSMDDDVPMGIAGGAAAPGGGGGTGWGPADPCPVAGGGGFWEYQPEEELGSGEAPLPPLIGVEGLEEETCHAIDAAGGGYVPAPEVETAAAAGGARAAALQAAASAGRGAAHFLSPLPLAQQQRSAGPGRVVPRVVSRPAAPAAATTAELTAAAVLQLVLQNQQQERAARGGSAIPPPAASQPPRPVASPAPPHHATARGGPEDSCDAIDRLGARRRVSSASTSSTSSTSSTTASLEDMEAAAVLGLGGSSGGADWGSEEDAARSSV